MGEDDDDSMPVPVLQSHASLSRKPTSSKPTNKPSLRMRRHADPVLTMSFSCWFIRLRTEGCRRQAGALHLPRLSLLLSSPPECRRWEKSIQHDDGLFLPFFSLSPLCDDSVGAASVEMDFAVMREVLVVVPELSREMPIATFAVVDWVGVMLGVSRGE